MVYRLNPEALQRAQVVGIAISLRSFSKISQYLSRVATPYVCAQVLSQIGLHAIIIDERVIDVE